MGAIVIFRLSICLFCLQALLCFAAEKPLRQALFESERGSPQSRGQDRPNVLSIIIDDAGWRDVGYMGGDIATPEIDRIAREGIRLNRFYTYSTCTPTRAAFFTGQAPSRVGIVSPIQHDDRYGIPAESITLPEVFRRQGYRTALIGKWHLGVQPELAPLGHGFDSHYGLRGGWTDHYTRENPETGYDWWRDNHPAPKEEGHTTDLLTAEAIRYIRNARAKPFFLCLSYTAPHVPIQVDPEWAKPYEGRFDTQTRVGYAGMMAQLDDAVGQVFQTLNECGLLDNTLVVFFSDNGPSAPGKKWYIPEDFHQINFYGNDGVYGDVGPLRGWKASPYDGGVRTPAFLYWKGTLTPAEWSRPVIVQDLYHTILGLVKLDNPLAGRNLFASPEPELFYWRTPKNLALCDGAWKLVVHQASPFESNLEPELYNMEADAAEQVDCAATHPEKCAGLLMKLRREFSRDTEPHVNQELLRREK
jgi:arylsulfatase A-like enzyme